MTATRGSLSRGADVRTAAPRFSAGPFIWGPTADLATFGGSAALAIAIAWAGRALGAVDPMPEWSWVVFVLAVDVAHVWSTLFRTYLDREEVAKRRALYVGLPVVLWALGAMLHAWSPLAFWRTLAYLAVFHFVRQQVGWVAIYRARAGQQRSRIDRLVDDGAIYASTCVPLFLWHASLPRPFSWFVHGDFVGSAKLAAFATPAKLLLLVTLACFAVRQVVIAVTARRIDLGKITLVATTAAIWWFGIVLAQSDFEFTVTNVVVHGVPYMMLLWQYSRFRAEEAPTTLASRITTHGIGLFLGLLVALAFAEEMAWDRFVWHDRPWLFGGGDDDAVAHTISGSAHAMPSAGPWWLTLVVPLLALPQSTHYALDAFLWRRRDTGPAQARALGFRGER